MKEVLKKYTFLVLLASENFLSPNVLKVYFSMLLVYCISRETLKTIIEICKILQKYA